jgi:hypothetical protein
MIDNKERTKRKGLEGGAVVVLFQCVMYKVKERQEEEEEEEEEE